MEKNIKKRPGKAGKRKDEAPPELVLPFDIEKKNRDIGEAVYDRRIPIFITVIVYLVLSIIFVSSKVALQRREVASSIMIDIQEMDELIKELEEAQKLNEILNEMTPDDGEPVRNVVSSEEGEEAEPEPVRQYTATEDFIKEAEELERRMRETREAYEEGLIANQKELERLEWQEKPEVEDPRVKPIKVDGKVTVYYTLKKPPRTAVNLFVPAYQCRKGGRVVVDIIVSTDGDVISASVVKPFSVDDWCMHETAVKAAYKSKFNFYPGAPPQQEGRIIYTFVPQEGRARLPLD